MERHFTRKDIEEITRKTHPPILEGETMEILNVSLLSPVSGTFPPVWVVEYRHTRKSGSCYESADILTEQEYCGGWHLWYLIREQLPEGCATPAEEDAAIKAEKERERARNAAKAVQP